MTLIMKLQLPARRPLHGRAAAIADPVPRWANLAWTAVMALLTACFALPRPPRYRVDVCAATSAIGCMPGRHTCQLTKRLRPRDRADWPDHATSLLLRSELASQPPPQLCRSLHTSSSGARLVPENTAEAESHESLRRVHPVVQAR